jgi:PAS domain S-box-containing protein
MAIKERDGHKRRDKRKPSARKRGRTNPRSPAGSEVKAIEAKLVRRTEVLRQVSAGILLTDAKGIITYFNPAFAQISGSCGRQLLGRYIEELSRERWEPWISEPLSKTIRTGESWHGYLSRESRGSGREWEMRISALRKGNRAVSGYLVSMRDVTDERRIEKRLGQVQKMEALGNLARGIAHDLRNIFTPIIVNVELLLMESGKEPRERIFLEQILRAARRGQDLVEQITVFGKGGEGERKVVSLVALIEDSLKILKPTLPSEIEIETSFAAREDRVFANPAQIHQIIMNLCSNAVQAMKTGGGVLRIGLESVNGSGISGSAAGTFLELSVGDTGCGMSPEVRDRVFEPFFTTKEGGSGMGLAVVHGIVHNLGGTLTVDSAAARGSVFRVFLPIMDSSAGKADLAQRGGTGDRES